MQEADLGGALREFQGGPGVAKHLASSRSSIWPCVSEYMFWVDSIKDSMIYFESFDRTTKISPEM